MSGDRPEPAPARELLAQDQSALLAALVAGASPPPGFDPDRLRTQVDALLAKRCDVVARLRPDLVEAAGAHFRADFFLYARAHPRPVAGARADADAFARTILPRPSEGRYRRWMRRYFRLAWILTHRRQRIDEGQRYSPRPAS